MVTRCENITMGDICVQISAILESGIVCFSILDIKAPSEMTLISDTRKDFFQIATLANVLFKFLAPFLFTVPALAETKFRDCSLLAEASLRHLTYSHA